MSKDKQEDKMTGEEFMSNWETLDSPPKSEDLVPPNDPPKPKEKVEDKEPEKTEDKQEVVAETTNPPATAHIDPLTLAVQANALPMSLQSSAQTSIELRDAQKRLIDMVVNPDYISAIAAYRPEVLPDLINSVSNGVAVSDNLMIQTMKEASKNANANKVLEYMMERDKNKASSGDDKDMYYDDSIEKIKRAIYHKRDAERNKKKKTARDYIDPRDTEVIDAEYTVNDEVENESNEDKPEE